MKENYSLGNLLLHPSREYVECDPYGTYVGGKIGRGMIYREMSFLWCLEDSSGRYEDEK